ncbi:MAG: ATP-binding cassette domain-containing protein [Pseudomonadota bacterium]
MKADNLSKTFVGVPGQPKRKVVAVESVSFHAADGCITGLLGPNGAGKSTTLRMLATLIRPDTGFASIDGYSITDEVLSVREHLGFMPHNAGIYPRLTAKENIQYYARLCGMNQKTTRARVDELIEMLDMGNFAERRCAGFSQGQKTKVALARALVHRPQTILLDEPTNGLDVMATRGLRDIIRQLARDGHCIVFSSHIMQEVAALCDEIAIISGGNISMTGSLQTLLDNTQQQSLEDAFVIAIGGEL